MGLLVFALIVAAIHFALGYIHQGLWSFLTVPLAVGVAVYMQPGVNLFQPAILALAIIAVWVGQKVSFTPYRREDQRNIRRQQLKQLHDEVVADLSRDITVIIPRKRGGVR